MFGALSALRECFESAKRPEEPKSLPKPAPPSIGQRVAVHNYHLGDHLESYNGQTGIVVAVEAENTYIRFDGHPRLRELGFPHENLLVLHGDLADLPPFVTPGKYGEPKHGLSPIPTGETGRLCSSMAAIGDVVEWHDFPPGGEVAFGHVTRELTLEEFRESVGAATWAQNADIYQRIGRFWECTKDSTNSIAKEQ